MMEKTCKSYGYYVNSNNMYMIIILVVYFTETYEEFRLVIFFDTYLCIYMPPVQPPLAEQCFAQS